MFGVWGDLQVSLLGRLLSPAAAPSELRGRGREGEVDVMAVLDENVEILAKMH